MGARPALFDLYGRVALVTGARDGLGLAMAHALASAGARVHLNGRDAERLSAVVAGLAAEGHDVAALPGDAGGPPEQLLAPLQAEAGRLDVLVVNAAQRDRRRLDDLPAEAFEALLRTNVAAAYGLVRAALPLLRASPFGARVILVTSVAGPLSRAGDAAYTASKGGLAALVRALAVELGREGMTVNAIAPGFFDTTANVAMRHDPAVNAWLDARVPLARWGRPEEIGGAAVFLASAAGAYVNGHSLVVDGGMSISF